MKRISLTLPLPSSWNHIYALNPYTKQPYLTRTGVAYKEHVQEYVHEVMRTEGKEQLKGDVIAEIWICWPDNSRTRDPENIGKLLFDTLKDHAFEDDCHMFPHYMPPVTFDKRMPRVHVIITEVGELDQNVIPMLSDSEALWQTTIKEKHLAHLQEKKIKKAARLGTHTCDNCKLGVNGDSMCTAQGTPCKLWKAIPKRKSKKS